MTLEEMQYKISTYNKAIVDIQNDYIQEHAKFKIGDIIQTNRAKFVIDSYFLMNDGFIVYYGRQYTKKGKPSKLLSELYYKEIETAKKVGQFKEYRL